MCIACSRETIWRAQAPTAMDPNPELGTGKLRSGAFGGDARRQLISTPQLDRPLPTCVTQKAVRQQTAAYRKFKHAFGSVRFWRTDDAAISDIHTTTSALVRRLASSCPRCFTNALKPGVHRFSASAPRPDARSSARSPSNRSRMRTRSRGQGPAGHRASAQGERARLQVRPRCARWCAS